MTLTRWAALSALAVALAGCSSSGDDDDDPRSYVELAAEGDRIATAFDDASITDPATLPTSGGATYDGVMYVAIGDDPAEAPDIQALGDARIEVDFGDDADPISGRADDFVSSQEDGIAGHLDFSNGSIDRGQDRGDDVLAFDIDGTLSLGGADYELDGDAEGLFAGSDADYLAAEGEGFVTTPNDIVRFGTLIVAED